MRILHVNLSPPGKGGIERLLVDFYNYLHGDEFQIALCILAGESAVGHQLAQSGCRIWFLGRKPRGFDWGLYPRLVRLLRDYRPDVIHLHGYPALIFGVPAARWVGMRQLVHTCHASQSDRSRWKHALLGSLMRLVPCRVAVSEAARRLLADTFHVPHATVEVIYNGVDLDRFTLPASNRLSEVPTIGFCGVFRPEKQIPVLIEAFARLRCQGMAARLLLVGDGVLMGPCRQMVQQLGVATDVTFTGEQTDVRPFLQQMDMFVLPSSQEAMPVALLEAMALQKAVVASAVGGICEIVTHEQTGLLVHSGDVAQLRMALERLVKDATLRQRLGWAARQAIVERFSLQQMMNRYAALYRQMGRFATVSSPAVVSRRAQVSLPELNSYTTVSAHGFMRDVLYSRGVPHEG